MEAALPTDNRGWVRVLFVEDEPALVSMYTQRLELDGCMVALAPDGETALQELGYDQPDIVVLDVRLPSMGGLEVLERLRADERTRALPVLILSNYRDEAMVERGLGLGALDYLIKSETPPGELSRVVRGLLQQVARG